MRTTFLVIAGLVTSLAASSVDRTPPDAQAAGASKPCVTATDNCNEWVAIGKGAGRSMVFRSYPLLKRNPNVTRALIMVHGTNRNADRYFMSALSATFLANAIDTTEVISPWIRSNEGRGCADKLAENEVNYSCGGDSWKSGGNATNFPDISSFDFVDKILRELADKNNFPNLKAIVVAGHSAGGQFVNRYEMFNKVHETLGVPVEYVVANPSSYAWPDSTRPLPVDDAMPDNAKAAWNSEAVHTKFSFGAFTPPAPAADARPQAGCAASYDVWPYGLKDRKGTYTSAVTDEQAKKQLVSRPTTYLLGQVDVLPLGGFDSGCNAMAQGATRRARGEAFVKFIDEKLGGTSKAIIIPECGHNDRCIYTTDEALGVLFPKPAAAK
jgi:pimeloyl-ACP methyl ester carboxylesterase